MAVAFVRPFRPFVDGSCSGHAHVASEGVNEGADERKKEQTALLPFHSRRASSSLVRVYPNETEEEEDQKKENRSL